MILRVLLGSESRSNRERLHRLLSGGEVVVTAVSSPDELWQAVTRHDFDLVVASRALAAGSPAGMVAEIRKLPEGPEVVLLTQDGQAEETANLLAAGCMAVVDVGLRDDVLRATFQALVRRRREEAMRRLQAERPEERFALEDFASASPVMRRFLAIARRVVASDSSLLILGETGVGKERVARAIHAGGRRSARPFLAVNCSAMPESLLESEIFGHEEGAFTGAHRARKGCFELAHGGTLFLDEIGELSPHVQVKLLRVLEDRTIRRVGGEHPVSVDVRIMAATNRDIATEIEAKRFRPDLYYRLGVVTLTVPPLRERREDIPALVRSYADHFGTRLGGAPRPFDTEAMAALTAYRWPGNVRELINVVERAVLLAESDSIGLPDLPDTVVAAGGGRGAAAAAGGGLDPDPPATLLQGPLRQARRAAMGAFERAYLSRLLSSTGGRVGETARLAGITERSLYDLMKRHGLRKESFRQR